MKTNHASILAVISLSLALCACDKGDKKEIDTTATEAAPAKPPKAEGAGAKGNPQPPESAETGKSMSPGAPVAATESTEVPGEESLKYLNGMVQMYNQRQSGGQAAMQPTSMKDPQAARKQYEAAKKKAAAAALTSLDQLVTAGIIKKLPDAPAGKKFVLDTQTQQVRLENQ